jgi:hypothetical protein
MRQPQRVGDLEIFQDTEFQRRFWRAQRVGWVVLALLVVAGLAGLFGQGALSDARSGSGDLVVEHPRLLRRASPGMFRLHASAAAARGGRLAIALDNALVHELKLEPIVPEPVEVIAGDSTTVYVFRVDGAASAELLIPFKARTWGRLEGRIAIAGRDATVVSMFVYP